MWRNSITRPHYYRHTTVIQTDARNSLKNYRERNRLDLGKAIEICVVKFYNETIKENTVSQCSFKMRLIFVYPVLSLFREGR